MDNLLDFPCCRDALCLPVVVHLARLHGMQPSKSGLCSTIFILCADDVKKLRYLNGCADIHNHQDR